MRFGKRFVVLFSLTAVLLAGSALCASAGEIRMGSAAYLVDVTEKFASLVEEKSGGEIRVKVVKDAMFEDEVNSISMVQSGALGGTTVGINKLGISPSTGFVSFPYIFPSLKAADGFFLSPFMAGVNERLRRESADSGGAILGVGWFTNDYRVLTNSKRAVAVPADLEGLAIRVPESRVMQDTFTSWGAKAAPLSWSEVPDALKFGTFDGQENPYSIIVGANLQETQKHLTPIKYNLWAGVILVCGEWYDALPENLKKAVDEAGREAAMWKMNKCKTESAEFMEQLKAAGVVFTEPKNETEEWAGPARKLWDNLYEKSGGKEWVDSVVAEIAKHE